MSLQPLNNQKVATPEVSTGPVLAPEGTPVNPTVIKSSESVSPENQSVLEAQISPQPTTGTEAIPPTSPETPVTGTPVAAPEAAPAAVPLAGGRISPEAVDEAFIKRAEAAIDTMSSDPAALMDTKAKLSQSLLHEESGIVIAGSEEQ